MPSGSDKGSDSGNGGSDNGSDSGNGGSGAQEFAVAT